MTDVMDDSVSWEQRREMRRKKRQELLAEADRLVKKTDEVASSNTTSRYSREHAQMDEEDDFEKERQRRRREREERRRKEREDLEKQLKEEEESRLEREKRREERRRLREESEREITEAHTPSTTYTSSTVITKEVEAHDEYNGEEETTVVTETTEVVQEYTIKQNGHYEEPEDQVSENEEAAEKSEEEDLQNGVNDDEQPEEQEEEPEEEEPEEKEPEEEEEPEVEIKETYKSSVTTVTVTTKVPDHHSEPDEEVDEVKQKLDELKLKRQMSDKRRYEPQDDSDETEAERRERIEKLEERKRLREQKRLEEERREKEEAAKREAEYQERLQQEREERERRRAEAEEKRREFRKKLSQSDDQDLASPLSPKILASPLVSKKGDIPASGDSDSSVESELSNSASVNTLSESKKMDGMPSPKSRPPAVPRRTQSARIKLSDYKQKGLKVTDGSNDKEVTYHPSRPLARKNRTRRSLDAMEKQADDLYDFLSELEHKKASCTGDELMNFLGENSSNNSSPAKGSPLTKRASIKDRAKVFTAIKEENTENAVNRPTVSKATKEVKPSDASKTTVLLPISNERPRSEIRSENPVVSSRPTSNKNSNNNNNNSVLTIECKHSEKIVISETHVADKDKSKKAADRDVIETEKIVISKTHVADEDKSKQVEDKDVIEADKITTKQEDRVTENGVVKEVSVSAIHVEASSTRRRRKPNIAHKPDHLVLKSGEQCSTKKNVITDSSATTQKADKNASPDSSLKLEPKKQEQTVKSRKKPEIKTKKPDISGASKKKDVPQTSDPPDTSNTITATSKDQDVPKERVEQLNKHITDTPKQHKVQDISVAHAEGLDSRLEKYTKQAAKQELKKTPSSAGAKTGRDVTDRRNKWERGEVHSAEKSVRKEHVIGAGGISSRKNLWESGKVGGSSASVKASKEVAEVKGADFSSRKNLWLKASQKGGSGAGTKKTESPVGMKTGVMNRLNQWEKGTVAGQTHDKPKHKADLPVVSGLVNRRAKFEQNAAESPKAPMPKQPVKLLTDVSDRKQRWESKAQGQAKSTPSRREHYGEEERPVSSASDRDGSYDGRRSYDDDSSQGRYQDDDDDDVSDEE